MSAETPSPAPGASPTNKALADLLGLGSDRRIYKWRREGAPAGLDHAQWRTWLQQTGRTKLAARLPSPTALDDILAESAPAAPAASAEGDPDLPPAGGWKALKDREQALRARMERLQLERRLIDAEDVQHALAGLTVVYVQAIQDGIWLRLRPLLDGLPADHRRELRRAHDAGVLDVRTALTRDVRRRLTQLLETP